MRWHRWSERTQVERVDVYTRQSLFAILWALPAVVLGQLIDEVGTGPVLGLLAASVLLGVAATWLLRRAIALHPASEPLPLRAMVGVGALYAVAFAALLTFEAEPLREGSAMILLSMVAWAYGGFCSRSVTVATLAASAAIPAVAGEAVEAGLFGLLVGGLFLFTVRCSLWLLGVVTELDSTRSAQAALAVAEERLRFARDVHDVMGRRLSTIAVQAELAATLAARGEQAAVERMLEVRTAAHDALREARELAQGYRRTELAQEVAGAGSLLHSAGIRCDVDLPALPAPWQEPAGWVVREAVTNVLRHSAATWVSITGTERRLTVANDGAPPLDPGDGATGPVAPGAGLRGLGERLGPLGATLEAERSGRDVFVLRVDFPEPASSHHHVGAEVSR